MSTQNRSQTVFVVAIAILLLGMAGILYAFSLRPPVELGITGENTFDYRSTGYIGKIYIRLQWVGNPAPNVPITIENDDFSDVFTTMTNENGEATIVLSDETYDKTTYYLKITYTARFIEGGYETRYIYGIFLCDPDAENILQVQLGFAPEVWKEEPSLKI